MLFASHTKKRLRRRGSSEVFLKNACGSGRIRTCEPLFAVNCFRGSLLKPLGHASEAQSYCNSAKLQIFLTDLVKKS